MTDYRELVSRTPPEGLLAYVEGSGRAVASSADGPERGRETRDQMVPFRGRDGGKPRVGSRRGVTGGELDTAGLVYRVEWAPDYSMEALLTDSVRKIKKVRVTCSECGGSVLCGYVPPDRGYSGKRGIYGFADPDYPNGSGYEARDGDSALCPVCRSPAAVRAAGRVSRGEFVTAETFAMSASLLPGKPGERPLVLTGWRIRRLVNSHGWERYEISPWEAYVFEQKRACKLNGWRKGYSGHSGYFKYLSPKWRQPEMWHETWGAELRGVMGLTPELLEESCMRNSKLVEFMAGFSAWKAPVPYLRLYQTWPQVENLVTQGAGRIVGALLKEQMPPSGWANNRQGLAELPDIDFGESRPARMLGLTKEEFRFLREQAWDLYHLRIFTAAKRAGDRMKLPEDIVALRQYGGEDVERLIGRAPVGKSVRYLLDQIMEAGAANDPYNEFGEFGEFQPEEGLIDAGYLADYWSIAREAGWDLRDPSVRWPKCLWTAHDRAMAASAAVRDKAAEALFAPRRKALGKFAYASGGLMIYPALRKGDLEKEGEALHHCVARYARSHGEGTTAIFFIRRVEEADRPFYTLELDERKLEVRQNRGLRNCGRTKEIQDFEDEWLRWVRDGCRRLPDGTPVGAKPVHLEAAEPSRAARMDRSEGEKPGTGWSRFEAETEGSRASGAGEA